MGAAGRVKVERLAAIDRSYQYTASGRDYSRPWLDRYLPHSGVVVDLGCGTNRFARYYDRPGRRVLGIDHDLDALHLAATRGTVVVAGDIMQLPLAGRSIDACIIMGVIEVNPPAVLTELGRVMKPGSIVYLTVPQLRGRRTPTSFLGYPLTAYSRDGLVDELKRFGFIVEQIRPVSLAWGLGPFRRLARLWPPVLVREDERSLQYRLAVRALGRFGNGLAALARREEPRGCRCGSRPHDS